jgi:hypothetical protein
MSSYECIGKVETNRFFARPRIARTQRKTILAEPKPPNIAAKLRKTMLKIFSPTPTASTASGPCAPWL